MDSILSVQKIPGDGKEFTKIHRAIREAESQLLTIRWNLRYSVCRHWGAGKFGPVRNPRPKAQCKGMITRKDSEHYISRIAERHCKICLGIRKSTPTRDHSVWSEDLSGDFRGSSVGDVSTKGRNVVSFRSGMDDKWCADSFECYCYLRSVQDLLTIVNTLLFNAIRRTIERSYDSSWSSGCTRPVQASSIWPESVDRTFLRICSGCGKNLERRIVGCRTNNV